MFEEVRHSRRSLREVLPPRPTAPSRPPEVVTPSAERAERPPARRSFSPTLLVILVLLIVIGGLVFFIGNAFAKVRVIITPRTAPMVFDHTSLTYSPVEVMTLRPVNDARIVQAQGTKKVEQAAAGTITIYNAYNSAPQNLIKGTRFQATNGKIYRSTKSVTVPGVTTKNGTSTPGSISVEVAADAVGADYNVGPTEFTIPGFKGEPQYDKFYARSKSGITGGASGVVPIISDQELTRVHEDLRQSLTSRALEEARAQIPENFVVYDGATFLTFEDKIEPVTGSSTSAKISTTATLKALLFDREALTKKLASTQSTALSGLPFTLDQLESLKIELPNKAKVDLTTDKSIALSVTGSTTAVATVDAQALSVALADKPKSEAQTIFGQFPGIGRAEIKITPLWLGTFPQDPTKNHVEVLYTNGASLTP